ncbi:MAG: 50S ribosomal protein L11 [Candidatus Nezhaarchaeota archaeon]|nr:50S ribosomal protein L11 [Candidatus Nezhaarchaeota archaeon]MCX8142106.1 50S ribosomal protein L11 [Candidatus Nezhaarchaeota archaeon]MDW8050113.1 50S ribosomal protein L11 [Nitrososphaerota archaeon]
MVKKTVRFIVEGGKATAGPPIGPALSPTGLNVMAVVNKINELTKEFGGMRVPVDVMYDPDTKEFEVKVGIPTTAALLLRELRAEKGSPSPAKQRIGDLTIEQIIKVALIKRPNLLSKTLKAAVKEILGTCLSLGITVDGKSPKDVQKEINEGLYDEVLAKYEVEWR